MQITGILWLEEIVEKLAWKHRVLRHEVRAVFQNRPHVCFIEKGHRVDENVYSAFGRTAEGRYLIVFYVLKLDHQALILSARDMTSKERKYYEKTL